MPHWPSHEYDRQLLSDFADECIQKNGSQFGLSNYSLKMIKDFRNIYKKKFHYNMS